MAVTIITKKSTIELKPESKILFSDSKVMVSPTIWKALGPVGAVFLQQVHYITLMNEETNNKHWYKHGHQWAVLSFEDMQASIMPQFSMSTIKRSIATLEKLALIHAKCYNPSVWIRKKWYRVDYKNLKRALDSFATNGNLSKFDPLHSVKMTQWHSIKMTQSNSVKMTQSLYIDNKIDNDKESNNTELLSATNFKPSMENTDMNKLQAKKLLESALNKLKQELDSLSVDDELDEDAVQEAVNEAVSSLEKVKETKTVSAVVDSVKRLDKSANPAIIQKYKAKQVNATTLALYWRDLLVMFHSGMGPVVAMSVKDKAQLNKLYEKIDRLHEKLYHAIGSWDKFIEHCKEGYGAFPLPKFPTIGFILKYAQGLSSFYNLQLAATVEPKSEPAKKGGVIIKTKSTAKVSLPQWSK